MLLPLDCHTAETGELVNGERSPFILTVDMGGRLCYSMLKILSLYSEFQITKFNRLRINNSAQVGQNFKNTFRQLGGYCKPPLLLNLDRSGGCVFFRINQFDKLEFVCLTELLQELLFPKFLVHPYNKPVSLHQNVCLTHHTNFGYVTFLQSQYFHHLAQHRQSGR